MANNMQQAATLLRQYEDFAKKQRGIDVKADSVEPTESTREPNRLSGTWSYTNIYDKLINDISGDKNFDVDMLQKSILSGAQDTYISLIQKNAGKDLDWHFYDDRYYDYNTAMLELYKSEADDTNLVDRVVQQLNPQTGQYEEVSLGKMSDKAYIQYQLDNAYAIRDLQIEQEVRRQERENMSTGEKVGHTIGATLAEFGEGVLSALTGLLDFIAAPFAAFAGMAKGESWGDAYVDYYAEDSLTAMEKETVRAEMDKWLVEKTLFYDDNGNPTWAADWIGGLANSIGMMIPSIVINVATGGAASGVAFASFYASIYSSNLYTNATDPATADSPSWLQIGNAFVTSAAEAVIEKGLAKFMGSSFVDNLIGVGGRAGAKGLRGITAKGISGILGKGGGIKYLAKNALKEGTEEFLQDLGTQTINTFTGMIYEGYEKDGFNFQTLIDSFFMGALMSAVMTGGGAFVSRARGQGIGVSYKPITEYDDAGNPIFAEEAVSKEVKGLKYMALSEVFAEFRSATDKLKKEKFTSKRNLELAQQVYTAYSTLTQLFSVMGDVRAENALKVLNRITENEKYNREHYPTRSYWDRQTYRENTRLDAKYLNEFATTLQTQFDTLIAASNLKVKTEKLREKLDKTKETLAENGVTKAIAVEGKDSTSRTLPKRETAEEKNKPKTPEEFLREKAQKLVEKGYEWVFVTDGHVAIDEDNMVFVSEKWLENYSTSEIYQFLVQQNLLRSLLTESQLRGLIKDVTEFTRKFTNKNMGREESLLQFLFNPSVYQAFILSRNGEYLRKHKRFVFRMHNFIKAMMSDAKLTQEQKNILNKIYAEIIKTEREPTIKALINWGFDYNDVGAAAILTQEDKQFLKRVAAEKQKGQNIVGKEKKVGDFLFEESNLLRYGNFSRKELAIIRQGRSDKATPTEKLRAVLLLNVANVNLFARIEYIKNNYANFLNIIKYYSDFRYPIEKSIKTWLQHIYDFLNRNKDFVNHDNLNDREDYELIKKYRNASKTTILNTPGLLATLEQAKNRELDRIDAFMKGLPKAKPSALTISLSSANLQGSYDIADVQALQDIEKEFFNRYGATPATVLNTDIFALQEMKNVNIDALVEDFNVSGAPDIEQFIIQKYENAFDGNYSAFVVEDDQKVKQIKVAKRLALEGLFRQEFIDDPEKLRDQILNDTDRVYSIKDFMSQSVDILDRLGLDRLRVVFYHDPQRPAGYYVPGGHIYINLFGYTRDIIFTISHELNHWIQYKMLLPISFGSDHVELESQFAEDIWDNYKDVIFYVIKNSAGPSVAQYLRSLTEAYSYREMLNELSFHPNMYDIVGDAIRYVAYLALEGEILAETGIAQKSLVKGYSLLNNDRLDKVRSPEGKILSTEFNSTTSFSQHFEDSPRTNIPVSDEAVRLAELETFMNVQAILDNEGYLDEEYAHGMYHTRLSRMDGSEIILSLIQPSLRRKYGAVLTIDEIIHNPHAYLAKSILNKMTDFSEPAVAAFLRKYIEDHYPGISIDRERANHTYVFVDNDSFDDLYNAKAAKHKDDMEDNSLVKELSSKNATFSDVYKIKSLVDMGIPINGELRVGEDVDKTETIEVKGKPIIKIKTDGLMSNAELLNKINHEFRHVLQLYNGLETGFTNNFKVTPFMLEDMKKHRPELFKKAELREIISEKIGSKEDDKIDTRIIQDYIYMLNGAEQEAYGIRRNFIRSKPIYVTTEGNNTIIFMPWYNAETGEGRYETKVLDKSKRTTPSLYYKPQKLSAKILDADTGYTNVDKQGKWRRTVSRETARGTNLEYYIRKNKRLQMSPEMQRFVVSTTDNLDKINPTIRKGIEQGTLTERKLKDILRTAERGDIDNFTFRLINNAFYHNSTFDSFDEVIDFIEGKKGENGEKMTEPIRRYWAVVGAFANNKLIDYNDLIETMSYKQFEEFMNTPAYTKWNTDILNREIKFDRYLIDGKIEEIAPDDTTKQDMRLIALSYFDGSIGSAYYVANVMRRTVKNFQGKNHKKSDLSLFATTDKGDEIGDSVADTRDQFANINGSISDVSNELQNNVTDEFSTMEEYRNMGKGTNSISDPEQYFVEKLSSATTVEEMKENLIAEKNRQILILATHLLETDEKFKKKLTGRLREGWLDIATSIIIYGTNSPFFPTIRDGEVVHVAGKDSVHKGVEIEDIEDVKFLMKLHNDRRKNLLKFVEKLNSLNDAQLTVAYEPLAISLITQTQNIVSVDSAVNYAQKNTYIGLRRRIKTLGTRIINAIQAGEAVFENLPKDVQDLFYWEEYKTNDDNRARKAKRLQLKPEAYQTGRKGSVSPGVDDLMKTRNTLEVVFSDIQGKQYLKKETAKEATRAMRELEKYQRREKLTLENANRVETVIAPVKEKRSKKGKVTYKDTTDTPNQFTVISDRPMPDRLKQLFDTSFSRFAETRVQFASEDADGNLYTKDSEAFESRTKHEVANFDQFYEANKDTFLSLNRQDVLDIVDFIENGAFTLSGVENINKLQAFQLYTLGYIIDAARNNHNEWDFSIDEQNKFRKLYESMASAFGSGLNAVKQMIDIVSPYKKVTQRMLDDFGLSEEDIQPAIDAATAVQTYRGNNREELNALAKRLNDEITNLQKRMLANNTRPRLIKDGKLVKQPGWVKELWEGIMNWRYVAMLSSPMTWLRNIVSNVVQKNFLYAADILGDIFVPKKLREKAGMVREDSWDLAKVKIDDRVKSFIENNVLTHPLFKELYRGTSKYDYQAKGKSRQVSAFTKMILNRVESMYYTNYKFNPETRSGRFMNRWSLLINKALSDGPFIRSAATKYLGKILTIELERGNISLDEGMSDRVLEYFAEAVLVANEDYMHKRSWGADFMDAMKEKRPVVYQAMRLFQPFLNTSWNWFIEGMKYTPLGLVTAIYRTVRFEKYVDKLDAKRAQGETVVDSRLAGYLVRRDIGKGIIGLALSMIGAMLYAFGLIGFDDDDTSLYLLVGDIKIDISGIFGTSSLLAGGMIAAFTDKSKDPEKIWANINDIIFDGFFFKDMVNNILYDNNFYEIMLGQMESILKSFVPQVWQLIGREATRDKITYKGSEWKGMWERFGNALVPGSPFGERVIDPYTGEVISKDTIPILGSLPAKFYFNKVSKEEELATSYGVEKKGPEYMTVNGVRYNLSNEAKIKNGQWNKQMLSQIQSGSYRVRTASGKYQIKPFSKMTDDEKNNIIDRLMDQNAELAKIWYWTQELNHKYYANASTYQMLRKLGVTKNVYQGDKGFVE